MSGTQKVERAFFQNKKTQEKIEVHFNPESLQYTVTNNLKNQGSGNTTKQYVADSTGKLTLDLIFDNTGSGEDIRLQTTRIARLMEPVGENGEKAPPQVSFEWGLYQFSGMVESYKETIDYFSANGVPLRASVNLTLASQEKVFEGGSTGRNAATSGSAGLPNKALPVTPLPGGKGATDIATRAGNPQAARLIAAANGLDSMRFPGTASIELDQRIELQGPTGFSASGSGGPDLGSGADTGVFSGLQAMAGNNIGATLDLDNFTASAGTAAIGVDADSIALGGSTGLQGSASLKASVGKAGALKSRLEFDGV